MTPKQETRLRASGDRGHLGGRLLSLARDELERVLKGKESPDAAPEGGRRGEGVGESWLERPGAVFVTLRRRGELRGCIGSLEPSRPLIDDLRLNAVAAALSDPRFLPVHESELGELEIEISLLSTTEPLAFASEDEALAQLRPGVDGVVLEWQRHRATFLPQMWETLRTPARFLRELKRKAGLDESFWHPRLRLDRYTVEVWSDSDLEG